MLRRPRRLAALASLTLTAGFVPVLASPAQAVENDTSQIFINEIHYDNAGIDAGEVIEVAAPAGTDLTGWTLVLYNGGTAASAVFYDTDALPSPVPSAGYVTVAYPAGIQNGSPDGVALVDATGGLVQFLSYEGVLTASNGPAAGRISTDIGVAEAGTEPVGQSLQLTGTGTTYGEFTWAGPATATPGAANNGQVRGRAPTAIGPVTACPASLGTTSGTATSADLLASDADDRVVRADDTTATPTAGIGVSAFTASPSTGATATATATVEAGVPAGTYPTTVTFTSSDGGTAACTVNVVVQPAAVERLVSQVQGSGATSPLVGQRVTVEGVVTTTKTRIDAVESFFLQEETGQQDADPATSEGLSVLCGQLCPAALAAGDVVRATGVVVESNGLTRLDASNTATGSSTRTGTGAPRPAAVDITLPSALPTTDRASFEPVESMLTRVTSTLSVADYFQLGRFGEVVLTSGGRPYQFTHTSLPSTTGNSANTIELGKRRIVLDDGSEDGNDAVSGPQSDEVYPYPSGGLSLTNRFRGGDTITDITAVMDYGFGTYRLQPVPDVDYRFTSTNPRTAAPEPVGGRLKVAAANVLNYFATIDTTSSSTVGACGPSGTADCRGADSQAELDRQRAKTVAELKAIDADVLGLIEIENDAATATVQLVDALNAATAPGTYDYVRTGTIGTDAIKQALLYKPAKVRPSGPVKTLTTAVDARFLDTRNRPSLIQTFRERRTGSKVTVAVNHFKSKGSACSDIGDPDKLDGAGNCDGTRTAAAEALRDYLATDPTGSGDPDFLVIGDLNSYKQERPITTLEAAGYTDLIERFQGNGAYGYLFGAQLGYLDHALASSSLNGQVTGANEWHINADEPIEFDYNDAVRDAGEAAFERESSATALYAADPYRSSDHDAVVIGLDLKATRTTPYDVQVLGINDFHGRLEPPTGEDTRAVPPRPSVGGAAFLSSAVEQLRGEVASTTFVSAGDNIGASPFASAVAKDEPTIAALNAMALEVTSVGNHEFDRGYADLAGRIANLAGFPFLGANVVGEAPELPTTHTVRLADGVTLGMIGVTTEQTGTLVSPDGIRGITFADIVASANAAADRLSDGSPANGEADVLVLMAHEGPATGATTPAECQAVYDRQDAFGAIARGVTNKVDAIIAGHTHQVVNCQLPNPGSKSDTDLRPVLEAGEYGQNLDRLRFTWNPTDRTISNVRTEIVPIRSISSNPNPATGFAPDPIVQRIVTDAVAAARVLGRPVIGSITADIRRAYTPTGAENRGAESVLGNFVADVQVDAVNQPNQPGAQIAFMNPGGLRTDLLVDRLYGVEQRGEITFGEAAEVQPFANTLFTLTLTGAQVKQVLEQQYQPAGATRPFLALGVSKGLFFFNDSTAPLGSRISGITLNGVALDPAVSYRIVTNSFLAAGGDNFPALAGGTNRLDTGLDDLRALVEFFGRNSPVTADTAPRRAAGAAPTPGTLSVADVTVVEGSTGPSAAQVVIRLDAARKEPVVVGYRTADGTARAVLDYTAASSTVTIEPGRTSATVTVALRPDLNDEPDETFRFALTTTSGPVLQAAPAVVTITDDDAAPSGEPVVVFGLANKDTLVRFTSDQPGRVERVGKVRGLPKADELVGIDFRPRDGRLYAVSRAGGVYAVDTVTARAVLVRSLTTPLEGTSFGVDVNPVADALRIVSDTGQNLRQPFSGGPTTVDTDLNAGGAPARGVAGAAYSGNDDAGATTSTTLYDLDTAVDQLVVQDPPNGGALVPVGPLGVAASSVAGFDITSTLSGGTAISDRGLAVLVVGGQAGLYEVSLTTGTVTARGLLTGPGIKAVSDLAIPTASATATARGGR